MTISIQPRKQRKALHQGPLHRRARQIRAHLSEELLVKYGKRSATVRVGDTIKVLRGKHAGSSGEVITVDRRSFAITVEGVTVKKADGKERPKPLHPSNVVLTKLVMTDKTRRARLGASEAEAEEAEAPAQAAPAPKAAKPAASGASRAPKPSAAPEPAGEEEESS